MSGAVSLSIDQAPPTPPSDRAAAAIILEVRVSASNPLYGTCLEPSCPLTGVSLGLMGVFIHELKMRERVT